MNTRRYSILFAGIGISLIFLSILITTARAAIGDTTRVSVTSDGTQGIQDSGFPSISADGQYVAYESWASNLVSGDTNGKCDIFVYDRLTRQTTRVSIASDGKEGNGDSYIPSISADGNYVAFLSNASNLVSGDTNDKSDIFVHDMQTGKTTRVSIASDGTQGNSITGEPSISANGRYVVFYSFASNLVSGDTNGYIDIFVHDLLTGQTTITSVASDGTQENSDSHYSSISADGRYIAFISDASNLISDDTNGWEDVFVHDRNTGQTTRVSVATDGTQGNNFSGASTYYGAGNSYISADGRYVTFISGASNLISGDTNGRADIFVHDLKTGQTTLTSMASNSTQGNNDSSYPSISSDGRYVTFASHANNLVNEDTNGTRDIFIHDLQTGQTTRGSVASDETQGNQDSYWYSSISANGEYVAFSSLANNLVSGDTNGNQDVFVHENDVPNKIISGNAGIAGITLNYTDNLSTGTATAFSNGNYFFEIPNNWSGTVTPSLNGYIFSPVNRIYSNVLATLTDQNYTATPITYIISGNAGVEGVTLSYTDGTPKTTTSDDSGNYSFTVSYGWSGMVTPFKSGFTFTPSSIEYTNVLMDQLTQNYSAIPITYNISGNAGNAGVTLSYTDGTPKTATSDDSGNYSFTVSYGWSGTSTPSKPGFTFTPSNIVYNNVLMDQVDQNYTANPITYIISGNASLAGVTLSYMDGTLKTVTTDDRGNYSFIVPYNWSGTVTPYKAGYTFSPVNKTYFNVTENQIDQNFIANFIGLLTPSNFRVRDTTKTSITIAWSDVGNEDGYKIYKWLYFNNIWDFYYLFSVNANVTSFTDITGPDNHFYQVSAYNSLGETLRTEWVGGGCSSTGICRVFKGSSSPLSPILKPLTILSRTRR
jgi:Tol biopolymer transport system component